MLFSFGGLPEEVIVGLRVRRGRLAGLMDIGAAKDARFMAVLICIASSLFTFHRSSMSEPELLALSIGVVSFMLFCMY